MNHFLMFVAWQQFLNLFLRTDVEAYITVLAYNSVNTYRQVLCIVWIACAYGYLLGKPIHIP